MSDSFLQKGFDDLLQPQNQYKSDRKYSQYIYGAAWGVEIIASLIGLFFAWSTGYNAYFQIEENERTTQTLIFAIQGALPFLLIAIIEPLKIPLAAGLYKVRIIGWKILILITLLGLTTITFETMFTSLEQNLTNVTQSVIKQSNTIRF